MGNIGQYQVLGELGRGAMAVVWLGYDPALDRQVAIKELLAPPNTADAVVREMSERFVQEARAVARLDHPGIVTVYAAGEYDGRAAMVMELLDGETLGQILARGPVHPDSVGAVVAQLLDSIAHAHAHGVIHRDIKPENVFVLKSGRVKMTDFGVAHFVDSGMTQMGTVIGTPGYMSPEQVQGLPVDARSDLFSIGVVAYELLTGANPFGRTPEQPVTSIMYRIVHEEVPDVTRVVPGVPRTLAGALRMMLHKAPDERPRDAAQALRCWTGAERPRTTSLLYKAFAGRKAGATIPPPPPPPPQPANPAAYSNATVIELPTSVQVEAETPTTSAAEQAIDGAITAAAVAAATANESQKVEKTTSPTGGGPAERSPDDQDRPTASDGSPDSDNGEASNDDVAPSRRGRVAIVLTLAAAAVVLAVIASNALQVSAPPTAAEPSKAPVRPVSAKASAAGATVAQATVASASLVATPPPPVAARTKVALSCSAKKLKPGKNLTLSVKASSDATRVGSGSAVVEWQKTKGSKWKNLKTLKLNKSGEAKYTYQPPKGTRYYRVRLVETDSLKGSTSKSKKVTVSAPAPRKVARQRTPTKRRNNPPTATRPAGGP